MTGKTDEEKADNNESTELSKPPFGHWNLEMVHDCLGFPLRFMHKFIRSEYFYMIMIGACCIPSFVLSIYSGITVQPVRQLVSSDSTKMNITAMIQRSLDDGEQSLVEARNILVTAKRQCEDGLHRETPEGIYCKGFFDGLWCWPHSRPGLIYRRCDETRPDFKYPKKYAMRVCEPNGEWRMTVNYRGMKTQYLNMIHCQHNVVSLIQMTARNPKHIRKKNYKKIFIEEEKKAIENAKKEQMNAKERRRASFPDQTYAIIIYRVGYAFSIVALILSIIIFSKFRVLMCVRSVIHINMFSSFVLKAFMVFVVDGVRDHMSSQPPPVFNQSAFDPNTISLPTYHMENFCKVVQVFYRYSLCTNYFWVLIEGLYLHNLMFVAFYPDKKFLTSYYVIGWGIPWLFVGPWAILRFLKDDTRCWRSRNHWVEMIYQSPLFSAMILNLFLFFNMLRVLWSKMKSPPHTNKTQITEDRNPYKKLLKSTLVCIPMFGAHQVLFMVVPVPPSSSIAYQLRMYWDTFFNSFQGFFVAIIYCLSNKEVLEEIRRCWNNIATEFQLSHNFRRRSRASITTLAGFSSTASQAPNANKDKDHNREILPSKVVVANEIPPKVEDTIEEQNEVKKWAACIRRTQDKKISDEEVAIPLLPFKSKNPEDDVISFDQELIDGIEKKLGPAEAEDDLSNSANKRKRLLSMTIEEDGETSSQDDHQSIETEQEESDEQSVEQNADKINKKNHDEQEESSTAREEKEDDNSTSQEKTDDEQKEIEPKENFLNKKNNEQKQGKQKQGKQKQGKEEQEKGKEKVEEQKEIYPKENLQNEIENEREEDHQQKEREEVEEPLIGKYNRRAGVKQTDF